MDKGKRNLSGLSGRARFKLTGAVLAGVALLLLARFFQVQVLNRAKYASLGESQSIRQISLSPLRGQIFDRNNVPMALNTDIDSLNLKALSALVMPFKAKPLKRPVHRLYPQGSLAGQLLGFVGRDGYGMSGVEFGYDRWLYGEAGWSVTRQDAKSRRVYELDLPVKQPVDGLSVKLTLDVNVQAILEACLKESIVKTGSLVGAVVVMDPYTGDILGMASYPFVDPNGFVKQSSDAWRNNAIGMVYEPGSTFKIVAAAAALEEGVFREGDLIATGNGELEIFGQFIHDTHKHGTITFKQAITVSSNVAFAKIAMALGDATYYRYVRNFGFGQRLGLGLPGEEAGILRPIEKWSGRTLVTLAMGQELAVTLLQMGTAYCAIANGGVLMTPRIVQGIYRGDQLCEAVDVRPIRRVLSPRTARRLTDCLTTVVEGDSGTGTQARVEGILIAGKTGTAQKIDPVTRLYMKDKYVASFAGFFPADNPRLMCMVILDEPQGDSYYGGLTAAPVFHDVVVRLLNSPSLPYGPRILADRVSARPETPAAEPAPDFSRLSLESAIAFCDTRGIRLNVEGRGKRVIEQSVKAGKPLNAGTALTLKTDETGLRRSAETVPDCMGLTVREAITRLLFQGIPFKVSGNGVILRQDPAPGESIKGKSRCLLEAG